LEDRVLYAHPGSHKSCVYGAPGTELFVLRVGFGGFTATIV
jgi:hypothetical protein